jgi:AcrR family transcriptional regulator
MSRTANGRQDTRRELLDATRRVVRRSGIASATVGEITREAGASLGLLNYHFASKDDVVAEAFAEVGRIEEAEIQDISRRYDDPADRLAAYLDLEEWADRESWTLWVDAWGESVHVDALRDTLDRFADGWAPCSPR